MAKKNGLVHDKPKHEKSFFASCEKAVDPALASLFASSSGPVSFTKREPLQINAPTANENGLVNISTHTNNRGHDTVSAISHEDSLSDTSQETPGLSEDITQEVDPRPKKRRRIVSSDNIEAEYLNRLVREERREELSQRELRKTGDLQNTSASEDESDTEEIDIEIEAAARSNLRGVPLHETMQGSNPLEESDDALRTVFLGNVSTEAIKSKSARKVLEKHLASPLKSLPKSQPTHKVESLRFRSTAFVGDAGPKKAAYAKKELMDQTTKCTNAYAVYSTELAAKHSAKQLNGTMVLDRHLRADCLATPARIDHRRCIFVGNLSFVDEETPADTTGNEPGAPRRPKAKLPADAEEGLWRTFSKAGKVDSVRVVRDKETRIGKGFAYVQFVDENGVEAALLMNDKKFPPMLPRKLRVMRAKKTKQKESRMPEGSRRQLGNSKSSKNDQLAVKTEYRQRSRSSGASAMSKTGFRKPENFVFEGSRASKSSKGLNVHLKRKKRPTVKPKTRSSRRGAAFKAAGGKRGRASE